MKHVVKWISRGRPPTVSPDPAYPNGKDIDTGERPACKVELPYPTKREVGLFYVSCKLCKTTLVLTTAGRPDDPRTVMVPCKAIQ
jgi:hypothetical protein